MTIATVTSDTLQQLAFDNPGAQIHYGAHEADLTLDGTMYVARLEAAAGVGGAR